MEPCRKPQVAVTPGQAGAGAGTAYLRVFVELAQGPACSLPRSPMVAVTSATAAEVARATETDATPVILDYIAGYYIAWNAPCGQPAPTGPLTVHITFSATLVIDMPIADFGPSCVDGTGGWSISMTADDRS